MTYEWKDARTGEVVLHDSPDTPPDLPGEWKRIYSFGVGRVEGGGGTPGRQSKTGS